MDKFKFLMSGLWSFLQPIIKVFLSDIGPILISTAKAAVEEMASKELTGEQKKDAAFEVIQEALIANSATVATHVINATIESAVAKLKAEQ